MPRYYVHKKPDDDGNHEVHRAGCFDLPLEKNRIDLGVFNTCHPAVRKAREHYTNVDGCIHCSKACHTS